MSKRAEARAARKAARKPRVAPRVSEPRVLDPILPLTEHQSDLMHAINTFDQIFVIGPAGTGKTYVPASLAADALMAGDIEKIILTRPAVDAGEALGFLPGDLSEKIAPYMRPLFDAISRRMGKTAFEAAMKKGVIEVIPFAFMRGVTMQNCWVLLDEAQNTTYRQMKLFLTRTGENCKVIIDGDITQRDIEDSNDGLSVAVKMRKSLGIDTGFVEFTTDDVVRSGLCKAWTISFDRHERKAPG